jgi:hypothetical protein
MKEDRGEGRRLWTPGQRGARWLVNGRTTSLGGLDFGDVILLRMVVPSAF